jgi:large subunit ribosomal protein L22
MATLEKKEVKATAKYLRTSPTKVRRILNLIRGKTADEGKVILKIMPHKAARLVEKVLKSAVANAQNTHKLNKVLKIKQACADQAFIMKRMRCAAKGRGASIYKRLSHITISVEEQE